MILGGNVVGTVTGGSVTGGSVTAGSGDGETWGTIEVVGGVLGAAGSSPAVEAPPPPAGAFAPPLAAVVGGALPVAAAVDVDVVGALVVGTGVWLPERT